MTGDGYRIRGYQGRHARHYGQEFGQKNVIFVIEADEGLRICHWGDNRADFDVTQLGRIDVLMAPVDDSEHILDLAEVDDVIARTRPRVVLPTHYHIPGVTAPVAYLGRIEKWLNERGNVRYVDGGGMDICAESLPDETQIWICKEPPGKKLQIQNGDLKLTKIGS